MNPIAFEKDIGNLSDLISPEQKNLLSNKMGELHLEQINPPSKVEGPAKNKFLSMSESQIANSLKTVDGLKRLEIEMSKVPGGKEEYDKIAKTMGIDLLFGGQLDISSKSGRIEKMLNDRNGRYYLRKTLGDNVVKELDLLARNNKLESALGKIEQSSESSGMMTDPDILTKSGDLLVSILKGSPISAIRKSYQLYKKIKKKSNNLPQLKEVSYQIE
jgi:hypothetical protein